jgi:hypothetical protein
MQSAAGNWPELAIKALANVFFTLLFKYGYQGRASFLRNSAAADVSPVIYV